MEIILVVFVLLECLRPQSVYSSVLITKQLTVANAWYRFRAIPRFPLDR